MDIAYEKMPTMESPSSSSVILIDGPIQVQSAPVNIRHYFVFSLFSFICLCPATGVVALAYSLKSSAKADVKFVDKARLYSRRALLWNILSVIFAIVTIVLVLVFCYYLNDLMTIYRNQLNQVYQNRRYTDLNAEVNKLFQPWVNNGGIVKK